MTVEKAIEFGNMWLDMNQDAKDSDTYQFFVIALKALGLTKLGLLKDCESCRAKSPCTDAISREYIQKKYATCADMLYPDADTIMTWVDEAPPVRVAKKEKADKWKKVMDKSWNYVWQCECGCRQGIVTNYCPDCGTKMER